MLLLYRFTAPSEHAELAVPIPTPDLLHPAWLRERRALARAWRVARATLKRRHAAHFRVHELLRAPQSHVRLSMVVRSQRG